MSDAVLFILRGLPASGKSTVSREMIARQPTGSIVRLNRDDIRAMMFGSEYRRPTFEAEKLVSLVEHGPIEALLRAGTDVIVDDTNLRTRFVKDLMVIADRAGATVKIMDEFLDVPLSECLRRDQQRENPVGDAVIVNMHNKYLSGGRRPHVPELDAVVTGRPYVAPSWPRELPTADGGTIEAMPVPGFEGYYAGTDGEVYSTRGPWTDHAVLTKLSASRPSDKHYSSLALTPNSGKARTRAVHLVILDAFQGPRPGKDTGSHLDGDHLNNRPENLAWESAAQNLLRRLEHGTADRGLANSRSSMSEARIAEVHQRLANGETNRSIGAALGVSATTISRVRTGARFVASAYSGVAPGPAKQREWSAPRAILCDLDGTVALNVTRGPYDTSRYHEDAPNPAVIDVVRMERNAGHAIVFCSGRDEEFRAPTEAWICEHVLPRSANWELFMRPTGDRRNDAIVKLELFDQHIRDRYNIVRVYDDRARVVAAYRSIGLTVLAVAPGDF